MPWVRVLGALGLLAACAPSIPRAPAPSMAPAPGDPARLRVASFNAWVLPVAADDLNDRFRRMPTALSRFGIDVLCLQEVWSANYKERLERALEAHFPHSARSSGGLLVLSRYPIVKRAFHRYPAGGDLLPTEWVANKGILETQIDTPSGRVRVVTTHMALDISGLQPGRRAQLRMLGRHVARWTDLPLVLTGDFNVPAVLNDRLTPDYRSIQRWGLSDTNAPRQRPDGSWTVLEPTRVGWPPHQRDCILFQWAIDYILYRNSPGAPTQLVCTGHALHLKEPCEALSDHHLVVADFQWVR